MLPSEGEPHSFGHVHPAPLLEWQRLIHAAQSSPEALHDFIQFLAAPNHAAEPLKFCSPLVGRPLDGPSIPAAAATTETDSGW